MSEPVRYSAEQPHPLSLRWQVMRGPLPKYLAYIGVGAAVTTCLFSYQMIGANKRLEQDYTKWKRENGV